MVTSAGDKTRSTVAPMTLNFSVSPWPLGNGSLSPTTTSALAMGVSERKPIQRVEPLPQPGASPCAVT
jgi:hypothetical protein